MFALIEVVLAAFDAVTGTRTRAGCLLYFLATFVLLVVLYLVFGQRPEPSRHGAEPRAACPRCTS